MPSGAKKRKAAKKKKENEAHINSSTNSSRRPEDAKSQDGKSSGSGEVIASALYHHHNFHNPLNGGIGELEKNAASSIESIVVDDKSLGIERIQRDKETIHELPFEDNCVVEVENELISAESYDSKSIKIEYIESGKKLYERDDENYTNSSDDQSSIPDMKIEAYTSFYKANSFNDKPDNSLSADAIWINKSTSAGETANSLDETGLVTDSVKSEVSVPKETIFLTKVTAVENTVVSDITASGLEECADKLLSDPGDGTRALVTYSNSVPKENDDKVLALSGENCQVSSGAMEHGSKYLEGKMYLSSAAPVIDADKGDAIAIDLEMANCLKNQTSASAPLVAQRTSLFSCCGLFDLLKGPNR